MQEFPSSPCVGSGLCCKTGPCGYGEWDFDLKQCVYLQDGLVENNTVIYRCGRYDYIKQQPGNEIMPAFGAGCCMSLFNSNRSAIIKEIKSGNEKIIAFFKKP